MACFGKKKGVTLFHLGFLVCADERGRGGNLFCFLSLGLSRRGGDSSRTAWTPDPLPAWCGRRGQTTNRFQDPAPAEPPRPGWHALCSQDCFLPLLDLSSPASRPLLSPRPSLPSENPASGVVAWSGVGEAAPDRMAMTWDVETVTSAFSSLASSTLRVRAA